MTTDLDELTIVLACLASCLHCCMDWVKTSFATAEKDNKAFFSLPAEGLVETVGQCTMMILYPWTARDMYICYILNIYIVHDILYLSMH
jgi:hypothetical protein